VKIFQVTDLLATGTAGTPGDNTGIGARRVDALVDHLLTHGIVDLTEVRGIASDASFDGCGDRDLVRDLGFRGLRAAG
jgi:hypothetical protein